MHLNPTHAHIICQTYFHIVFPPTPRFPIWSLLYRLSLSSFICFPLSSMSFYTSCCPSQPPWFSCLNHITRNTRKFIIISGWKIRSAYYAMEHKRIGALANFTAPETTSVTCCSHHVVTPASSSSGSSHTDKFIQILFFYCSDAPWLKSLTHLVAREFEKLLFSTRIAKEITQQYGSISAQTLYIISLWILI